ncbi:hypothetical protein [Chryseobacterium gwangjuense]|uniref:hypothetical protein n=1 Tax=Chryseobacterium gwangjuense TaxID=1069980 RepID=UPI001E5CB97B|nr:hypothetical protein [Chryseobacterium gwangjuense]MCE3075263.1 hypothetical protein [Chryseobacterium gwangjuense]
MKKKLIVLVVLLFVTTIYFVFYHKDKTLKFVPENADVLVLIDVKKCTRQYISSLAMHPSQWLKEKNKNENVISIQKSGVKIPDFLPIFHIVNTKFSEWYSVVEIEDEQKFLNYLKQQKFIHKGKNRFQKDQLFLTIDGKKCIIGTSDLAFKNISNSIASKKENYPVTSFIHGSLGSISFISGSRTRNFSIELNADDIEIKDELNAKDFHTVISKLQQKESFLETELDSKNLGNLTSFFNKNFVDSSQITHVKATADLEQVNDTIITYGYDDNFNEIEKKSFQKIIQPNYVMALQSSDPQKTEQLFQHKKWINTQNQFTAIPFQPNVIEKNKSGFTIQSTRKAVQLSSKLNENYIFVRNTTLLSSSFKSLTADEKKIISDIDYIFYGNKSEDYYVKLKFKKEELPLILRW